MDPYFRYIGTYDIFRRFWPISGDMWHCDIIKSRKIFFTNFCFLKTGDMWHFSSFLANFQWHVTLWHYKISKNVLQKKLLFKNRLDVRFFMFLDNIHWVLILLHLRHFNAVFTPFLRRFYAVFTPFLRRFYSVSMPFLCRFTKTFRAFLTFLGRFYGVFLGRFF